MGIYTAGHPVDSGLRRQGLEFALPITIEDGVWIGGHAVIAPGVRIGRNSVIGAGSVVPRDGKGPRSLGHRGKWRGAAFPGTEGKFPGMTKFELLLGLDDA